MLSLSCWKPCSLSVGSVICLNSVRHMYFVSHVRVALAIARRLTHVHRLLVHIWRFAARCLRRCDRHCRNSHTLDAGDHGSMTGLEENARAMPNIAPLVRFFHHGKNPEKDMPPTRLIVSARPRLCLTCLHVSLTLPNRFSASLSTHTILIKGSARALRLLGIVVLLGSMTHRSTAVT